MENINVVTKEFITKNNLPTIVNFDDATKEGTYKVDNSISSNTAYPSLLVVIVKDDIIKQTHYDNNGDIKGREFNGSWSEFTKINKAAESATPTNNNIAIDLYWDYKTVNGEYIYEVDADSILNIFNKYKVIRVTLYFRFKIEDGANFLCYLPCIIYNNEMYSHTGYMYSPWFNIPERQYLSGVGDRVYSTKNNYYLECIPFDVVKNTIVKLPVKCAIIDNGTTTIVDNSLNHYIKFI